MREQRRCFVRGSIGGNQSIGLWFRLITPIMIIAVPHLHCASVHFSSVLLVLRLASLGSRRSRLIIETRDGLCWQHRSMQPTRHRAQLAFARDWARLRLIEFTVLCGRAHRVQHCIVAPLFGFVGWSTPLARCLHSSVSSPVHHVG